MLLVDTGGQEGIDQGLSEIEDTGEILALVRVLFPKNLFLDEEKYHVADMLTLSNPPFGHYGGGHWPELLQSEIAETDEQLRAGDMARQAAIAFRHSFECIIQRIFEEEIRMGIKTLVSLEDGNHGLLELHGLHAHNLERVQRRVKGVPVLPQFTRARESGSGLCGWSMAM